MAQGSVTPSPRQAKGGGSGSGDGGALRAAMLVPGFTLLLPQIPPYLAGFAFPARWATAGRHFVHVAPIQHFGKEPPSRLSPPRTRGAPSRIPSLGRCGGLLADPSPCSTEPQGWASAGADAPGQRRGAGPGTRSAAGSTKPSSTGRRSRGRQGRGAAERHLAARPSPPRRLPRLPVGAGARQHPLEILFLETGEALALPLPPPRAAVSPTPAAQPGCQPANYSRPDRLALCLGSNEIPAPAMCQQEQRRVLCSGEDAGAAQLGWKGSVGLEGQRGAGRTVGPSQKQGARRRVRRAPCGEAGMQELSLVSLASRASEGPCCLFGPAL